MGEKRIREEIDLGRKVEVRNLGVEVTWQLLKDFIRNSTKTEVSYAKVFPDGYAQLEFPSPQLAASAVQLLQNSILNGRPIQISLMQQQQQLPLTVKRSKLDSTPVKVYVGNLAWQVTWRDLKNLAIEILNFIQIPVPPNLIYTSVATYSDTGRSKGWGTIELPSAEYVQPFLHALQGRIFFNRPLNSRIFQQNTLPPTKHLPFIPNNIPPKPIPTTQLYGAFIDDLPETVRERDIVDFFKAQGFNIAGEIEIFTDSEGVPSGSALVKFPDEIQRADAVKACDGKEILGKKVKLTVET